VEWKTERVDAADIDIAEVTAVYNSSGLGARRPVADTERFAAMLRNANLIVVCRVGGALAGVARSISDFSYVTYLSDIAVAAEFQRRGIGRALIAATRAEAPAAKLVLLSAPAAVDYYPHIGFTRHESAWVLS
jgi:ribosomal protein S18 acetylase RimI-like enzyme